MQLISYSIEVRMDPTGPPATSKSIPITFSKSSFVTVIHTCFHLSTVDGRAALDWGFDWWRNGGGRKIDPEELRLGEESQIEGEELSSVASSGFLSIFLTSKRKRDETVTAHCMHKPFCLIYFRILFNLFSFSWGQFHNCRCFNEIEGYWDL